MTDRIKGLTVVLDRDYRDDDVEVIVNAILMVKGVSDVGTSVVNQEDYMNRVRIVNKLRGKLYDAVGSVFDDLKLD